MGNKKEILIIVLVVLGTCIMVGALATPFIIEEMNKQDACEELGGYVGDNSLCYKEDSQGDLVGYKVKKLGGKYRLVR